MTQHAIADYALLSDCHAAALVARDGSIDWLCWPRFDSPSLFGHLLDQAAGRWCIRTVDAAEVTRAYLPDTLVLETTYATAGGTVVLLDALAVGRNERGHELGAGAPSALLRILDAIEGDVELEMEFSPRPEYGLVKPLLRVVDEGLLTVGGADRLALSSPIPLTVSGATATARFRLRRGERLAFALQHRTSTDPPPAFWAQDEIESRAADTAEAWRTWSEMHQAYEGPWRDLVHHSGRVLYALQYYPTGAICAAPTTSLPETPGGERNWDYRYAWVRDASFTMRALWVAACPDEGYKFFDYLASAAASQVHDGGDLQIMFGIGGERDLTERVLPHLSGWRGSAPVRVGNGAWTQRQIDVYGELLDAAARFPELIAQLEPESRTFLVDLANAACHRWQEQDQGIWEVRGEPRDFVYSKLMCWVALDRAIGIAEQINASDRVDEWAFWRGEIASAILTRGWSDNAGAFAQSFGSDDLDASNLMMSIVGFLPPDDPRIVATIDAICDRLTDEQGLVYRYLADDGLEGDEGTFLLCTFWLAEALALAGEHERARSTFERAVAFANDVGLLSEEVDASTGELLGNFPQAFSHIGLVNAAWAISQSDTLFGRSGGPEAP